MKNRRKIFIEVPQKEAIQILIDVVLKKACETEDAQRLPPSFKKMFGTHQMPTEIRENNFDWEGESGTDESSLINREKLLKEAIKTDDNLVTNTESIKDSIVNDVDCISCINIEKEC